MRVIGLVALLWLAALETPTSLAAEAPAAPLPPAPTSTDPAGLCKQSSLAKATVFPQVREAAIQVRRVLCVEGGKRDEILTAFSAFVAQLEGKWFLPYGGFRNGADPLHQVREALQTQGRPIPTMALTQNDVVEVAGTVYFPASQSECDRMSPPDKGCGSVLDEFISYYNYAHTTFASEGAIAFAQTVSGLSKQWSDYLDSSRAFTPLELLINSRVYNHSQELQFSSPPAIQWIVLHPSLVVENVQDAVDGERTKQALMVEIGGANWWRQTKWYLPTGGSVVTVYSDRPDSRDFGWGLALHFRSIYSVGYTRRGEQDGVFVSFDLLKLLQDKRKVLESFKP